MSRKEKKRRGTPIGIKLILITSFFVIISLGTLTFLVNYFVGADVQLTAEDNNHTITMRTASTVENELSSIRANSFLMLDLVNSTSSSGILLKQTSSFFFERNPNIASVIISGDKEFYNERYFSANEIETQLVQRFLENSQEEIKRTENGESFVLNAAPVFNLPILALMLPWKEGGTNQAVTIFFDSNTLTKAFGTGKTNISYLINDRADLLVYPDFDLIKAGANLSKLPLVDQLHKDTEDNRQVLFTDIDGEEYFGSYCKLSIGDLSVITLLNKKTALKAVSNQTYQNIWLSLIILFVTILFIWLFSKSISIPLRKLQDVANEIKNGNFNTPLFDKLNTRRRDEIGVLNQNTVDEREILNTISRLTNKEVAKAVVTKEIDFNSHLKDITIFFSDIRDFTSISDNFNKKLGEKSAEEIINFLNDYMSRMVNCIKLAGGTVDKFEGDAIMACWGLFRDDDLSFEKLPDSNPKKAELAKLHMEHIKEDALNSVKAAIAMRYTLMLYNKEAAKLAKLNNSKAITKPLIKIGAGINSGRATVGFMGSYDKMEFTSIGDSVNMASRTEGCNKICGTDMLITEDTYNLLKQDYIRCEANQNKLTKENLKNEIIVEKIPATLQIKGKGTQHFYGIVNMPNFDISDFFKASDSKFEVDEDCKKAVGPAGPKSLKELRALLGLTEPNFGGTKLDAEESKVTIS